MCALALWIPASAGMTAVLLWFGVLQWREFLAFHRFAFDVFEEGLHHLL